jgi:hypothetical protein
MPREVFIALAKAFKATRPTMAALRPQWLRDVAVVAGVCKSFNATFDRARFLRDAGVENGDEQ